METSPPVELVEDDDLSSQPPVFPDKAHGFAGFDGFQQIAPGEMVKILVQVFMEFSIPRMVFAQEIKPFIDLLPDGIFRKHETAVIIKRRVQIARAEDALSLQPGVEVALHQAGVHIRFRLCQFAVAHAVAEVLDHEGLAPVRLIVATALPFGVVEQEAFRIIDAFLVGKGGRRKQQHAGHSFLAIRKVGPVGAPGFQNSALHLFLPFPELAGKFSLPRFFIWGKLLPRLTFLLQEGHLAHQFDTGACAFGTHRHTARMHSQAA